MTVAELIEALQRLEDKYIPVTAGLLCSEVVEVSVASDDSGDFVVLGYKDL